MRVAIRGDRSAELDTQTTVAGARCDGAMEAPVVEPVDAAHGGGELDGVEAPQWRPLASSVRFS